MTSNTHVLKTVIKNKAIHYVFSRYATYGIQFVNSLFIAAYLGPYYLGVWGFINLILQYLAQINFGISPSVNAIIAIHKDKEWYVQKVIGTAITMLFALSLIVVLFFVTIDCVGLNIGSKYNFSIYAPLVVITGILSHFNTLFANIFRVYGKVIEIAINQSSLPVLTLIVILVFRGENLIWALVGINLLSAVISLLIYILRRPVSFKPALISRLTKEIQVKGWHLFVYNTSFHFIIISTRSFVSLSYSIEEFGYFTFAFTLANVALLLLESISFLVYPKLLNRLSSGSNKSTIKLLDQVRDTYIVTSHFLIHIAILLFPVFLLFFPQYSQSVKAFSLIALTIVLYTNSFGYSGLLISKNKEKELGYLALFSLGVNIVLAYTLSSIICVPFVYVIISTMTSYFIYVFLLSRKSRKLVNLDSSFFKVLKDVFPANLMLPYFTSIIFVFMALPEWLFVMPVILFVSLNYRSFINIKLTVKNIILNAKYIDI